MIKTIFNCIVKNINCNDDNEIIAVGSDNTTSDFDVSILGPDGNNIMWGMFITFLAKYQNSLSKVFDSNLYSSPLYIHRGKFTYNKIICKSIYKLPTRVDYNHRFFIILPISQNDIDIELNWACIKLLNLNINIPNKLKLYFENALKYKEQMDLLYTEIENNKVYLDISLQNNLHPANSITPETRNIIKKYYLQYLWQKNIHEYIYSNDESNISFIKKKIILTGNKNPENNFFFYSNIPNYFSSEAYYTSSTMFSIVIEHQMNVNMKLFNRTDKIIKQIYIISAIENLGDMIFHMKKDAHAFNISKKQNKIYSIKLILIKYSKYLLRIYKCLAKINNILYQNKYNTILKYVIPFRKTYDINNASKLNIFDYLYYNDETDFNEYINKFSSKILFEINIIINNM